MVDISPDFHHIPQTAPMSKNKPYSASFYSEPAIRCDECPSAKICKEIGNFRKSCELGVQPLNASDVTTAKCIAGTNILLARLLKKFDKG